MRTIRSKFAVDVVERTRYGATLKASPVTSGSEENKALWDATPSGKLELNVSNAEVLKGLEPGVEFFLDITVVE